MAVGLLLLIVAEAMRGQGVGSALVAELFSRLTSLACAEVCVAVMPTNRRAIKFYQAQGLIDEALFLDVGQHTPRTAQRVCAVGARNRCIARAKRAPSSLWASALKCSLSPLSAKPAESA